MFIKFKFNLIIILMTFAIIGCITNVSENNNRNYDLYSKIMCPVCDGQTIGESQASISNDLSGRWLASTSYTAWLPSWSRPSGRYATFDHSKSVIVSREKPTISCWSFLATYTASTVFDPVMPIRASSGFRSHSSKNLERPSPRK